MPPGLAGRTSCGMPLRPLLAGDATRATNVVACAEARRLPQPSRQHRRTRVTSAIKVIPAGMVAYSAVSGGRPTDWFHAKLRA